MGDGLRVVGGVGGVVARTDDMRRHADLLDVTGDAVRRASAVVAVAADVDVVVRTAAFAPTTAVLAQAAVLDAGVRVGALAARVEVAAQGLRCTAFAVLAADQWPRAAHQRVTEVLSPATLVVAVGGTAVLGLAGVVEGGVEAAIDAIPWVGGPDHVDRPPVDQRMLDEAMRNWSWLVQQAPWLVDGVVHGSTRTTDWLLEAVPSTAPIGARVDSREDLVAELLAVAPDVGALVDTPVTVAPVATADEPAPRSLVDVVQRQRSLMDRALPDSQSSRIQVAQVHGATGTSWIVLVPGTQEWPLRSQGDPSDLTTNAHLSALGDAALLDAVDDAMRTAGVAPDDPVLVAGHSQGGITAAAFARQADARDYNVTHVFTQGSPLENLPPPSDVHALSLEHTDDVVPRLDSGANADLPNHTTVLVDSGAAVTTNVVRPHGLDLYARTMDTALDAGHPSVRTFADEVTDRFLQGDVVTHEFVARRDHEGT